MVKSLKHDFQTVDYFLLQYIYFFSKIIIEGNSFEWPNETVEPKVSHTIFSDKEGRL